jgi:hypothetical protein
MATTTNIVELKAHIKMVFNNLLKTSEFKASAKEAGEAMKQRVQSRVNADKYDYIQTGNFKRLLREEKASIDINKTGSKAVIGFAPVRDEEGGLDDWLINDWAMRGPQNARFTNEHGETTNIKLRPEQQLPNWIIMEFGRKAGSGASARGIPKDFIVPYTAR